MDELAPGVQRVTLPLPTGPRHVHSYVLEGDSGGRLLVDTGLGLPGDDDAWRDLGVERVFVTHFHPDHVGGAQRAAEVTRAPVVQGELDYAQCERVWGSRDWPERIAAWFRANGVPAAIADALIAEGHAYAPFIRFEWNPEPVRPGEDVDGWSVVAVPGHADGHLALLRDGVFVCGDHLLGRITPAVGLYPESRPDPLGDYLASLERTIGLAPRVALPGHGDPILDPAARAREIVEHHRTRLDDLAALLTPEPQTGYELSLALFGADLGSTRRRFAVAETLSHAERLVREARAARVGDGRSVAYTAP